MRRTLAAVLFVTVALLLPAQTNALETNELLALIAMPLAVAAVAETTDVPIRDLMDVVTLLNAGAVPPSQFVEVVRYVPVALVETQTEPRFVDFLRTQTDDGLRGTALVTSIEERLRIYEMPGMTLALDRPGTIDVFGAEFVPTIVRTRMAERRGHPHGGPPGQIKKQIGVQTGAEVVHGSRPGTANRARPTPNRVEQPSIAPPGHSKPRAGKAEGAPPAQNRGQGKGAGKGGGQGNNGGKGKGKGNQ
ncbi:MAG TPA: hypothetical protein VF701_05130 [Thermoanaerobaculia bacterium]